VPGAVVLDHLDPALEDHDEVIGLVAVSEEHLPGLDLFLGPIAGECGELRVTERRLLGIAHRRRARRNHSCGVGVHDKSLAESSQPGRTGRGRR